MPGVVEQIGWYVYLLMDSRYDHQVFYVGKGHGERCFTHLAEARQTEADLAQGFEKLVRIRDIEASGGSVEIELLRYGLTEIESLVVESVAIDLLGLNQLTNLIAGHGGSARGRRSVAEINAMCAKPVAIDPSHSVVLVNIGRSYRPGISDAELYERTRQWWKIGESKREVGACGAPDWAFAVAGGVVRAVYRITVWEQATDMELAKEPTHAGRWAFRGTRDVDMEDRYLNGDVSRYMTSQWPLRYVSE